MARKKKTALGAAAPVTSSSPARLARRVVELGKTGKRSKRKHAAAIAYFHELNKRIAQAESSGRAAEAKQLKAELEQLGGLAAYQAVSLRSEAAGSTNTSRWVVKQLQKLRLHQPEARRHFLQTGSASAAATAAAAAGAPEPTQLPATAAHAPQGAALPDAQRLRLLDVGALAENYKAEAGWIRARAIDLNSQTPAVARADFFDEPLQPPLDVLSLCLVMNFVGDPKRAGQMLWKAAAHLRRGGLLAVMVPRACVDNSRYCTDALFQQALQHVGFAVVTVDHSARLARYMARRVDDGGGGGGGGGGGDGGGDAELPGALSKRTVVRSGGQRNNFCVLLTPKWTAEEGSRQATA